MSMIEFKNNPNLLSCPLYDSPFFDSIIKHLNISDKNLDLLKEFNQKGYVVINLDLEESIIYGLNFEIDELIKQKTYKSNSSFFNYNDSPRIVDTSKQIDSVRDLAINAKTLQL